METAGRMAGPGDAGEEMPFCKWTCVRSAGLLLNGLVNEQRSMLMRPPARKHVPQRASQLPHPRQRYPCIPTLSPGLPDGKHSRPYPDLSPNAGVAASSARPAQRCQLNWAWYAAAVRPPDPRCWPQALPSAHRLRAASSLP